MIGQNTEQLAKNSLEATQAPKIILGYSLKKAIKFLWMQCATKHAEKAEPGGSIKDFRVSTLQPPSCNAVWWSGDMSSEM